MRRCLDLLVPRGLGVFVIPFRIPDRPTKPQAARAGACCAITSRSPSASRARPRRGKDLFPGAHNVVDVLVWRARGGELKQVDPGDEFILDGRYFKEHPAHILGTEGEGPIKARRQPPRSACATT
jgi:hypothetical protein